MPSASAPPDVPTGHPPGFWFFFWGEFAERCSYYGMRAILAKYMIDKLGVAEGDAGTFMSLFIAACYFFPLLGGYIADNFLGKYWTIVGFSVPYVVAQFLVGMEDKYIVFMSLVLLAMGSGVIKPNISTLMGLTYDQQRPGQDQLRTSAFSWFYMAINIGAWLSQMAMPLLRNKYGYQVAFLFPAGLMAMALVIFALGKRFYGKERIERKVVTAPGTQPPDGRTITGLPVVYKAVTPEEKQSDFKLKMETLSRIGLLFLTVMFFWAIFDQSASTWIFFADTYMDCTLFGIPAPADAIQSFNALFIIILVPISVFLFKSLDRAGMRVKATQKLALGFILTGLSMAIMSVAGSLAGAKQEMLKVTTAEGVLVLPKADASDLSKVSGTAKVGTDVPVSATDFAFDEKKKKLSFTNGTIALKNGQVLTVSSGHLVTTALPDAAGLTAGGVAEPLLKSGEELKSIKPDSKDRATLESIGWVKPEERVTVWWQVFAYLIITVAEILISVTGLELAFVAAPKTMKSFVTGCWLAVVGLANLVINAPITQLYQYMTPSAYFAMLGGAMVVVIVVFIPIAAQFNRAMLRMKEAEDAAKAAEGNTEAV
ncbi:MFS transporter [Gemmata sp. JC717]|uniref:peptide MFS transporter n=1 Tax=Gemmata algarum TaxID=2975278 RepID=UPI0021BB51B5|nr:MFS transporter [Gemmata algarum]MDY3555155.1 MFS transporter [Gemmata algarum]